MMRENTSCSRWISTTNLRVCECVCMYVCVRVCLCLCVYFDHTPHVVGDANECIGVETPHEIVSDVDVKSFAVLACLCVVVRGLGFRC